MKESLPRETSEVFLPCKMPLILISPTALYMIISRVVSLEGQNSDKFQSSFICHKLLRVFIDLVAQTTMLPLECDLSLFKVEERLAMKISQFPFLCSRGISQLSS